MCALETDQLRRSATREAAEAIADGGGDDAVNDAILYHLLIYGGDELTLGELRTIAAEAFTTAIAAARQRRGESKRR